MKQAGILFVDDEPRVTDAIRRSFKRAPYRLYTAASAAEGLQCLATETIDVVVSDERMPGMSGAEFLAQVRQQYPDTIRIILSGQADLEAAIKAINEGEIYRFLVKPCDPADLRVTIDKALEHKRLLEQSRRLLREYQKANALLEELEAGTPGITRLETDADGAILVDERDAALDLGSLLAEIEAELDNSTA